MNTYADFTTSVAAAERALVAGLELRPLPIPAELARIEGAWRGGPVTLSARAYRGPRTAYARFVELSGAELVIGNVLCLSTPEHALPILGADLVALAKDSVVAVADLSPVPGAPPAGDFDSLAGSDAATALPRSEPPAWAASWLSSSALVTRAPANASGVIARAVAGYWRRYLELARDSVPHERHVGPTLGAQAAYAQAHVRDDRGLNLLGKIFAPSLAERFVRKVLFPERTPSWT